MRFAIIYAAIIIGVAINPTYVLPLKTFLSIIIMGIAFIIADIAELIHNLKK